MPSFMSKCDHSWSEPALEFASSYFLWVSKSRHGSRLQLYVPRQTLLLRSLPINHTNPAAYLKHTLLFCSPPTNQSSCRMPHQILLGSSPHTNHLLCRTPHHILLLSRPPASLLFCVC